MVSLQRSGPRGICETVPTDRSPWAERASSLCFSGCSNQQLRPLGNLSSAEPLPSSICRGHGQMVRPEGGVKVGPEAAVHLRRDDLPVGWPPPVDLLAEQRGGIERVDRKSTRLNSSHRCISDSVLCLIKGFTMFALTQGEGCTCASRALMQESVCV